LLSGCQQRCSTPHANTTTKHPRYDLSILPALQAEDRGTVFIKQSSSPLLCLPRAVSINNNIISQTTLSRDPASIIPCMIYKLLTLDKVNQCDLVVRTNSLLMSRDVTNQLRSLTTDYRRPPTPADQLRYAGTNAVCIDSCRFSNMVCVPAIGNRDAKPGDRHARLQLPKLKLRILGMRLTILYSFVSYIPVSQQTNKEHRNNPSQTETVPEEGDPFLKHCQTTDGFHPL
jgi:hypothetical protein